MSVGVKKRVRLRVNRTPNGYASLVIRANGGRRLKAIRQKYNRDPRCRGSAQEWPLVSIVRLIDGSSECSFLDNRCEWPIKAALRSAR